MKCLSGFQVTLKCLTLSELEMSFYASLFSSSVWLDLFYLAFGDSYVKTIEGTAIPRMFDMGSGVWQYKVACTETFAGVRAS